MPPPLGDTTSPGLMGSSVIINGRPQSDIFSRWSRGGNYPITPSLDSPLHNNGDEAQYIAMRVSLIIWEYTPAPCPGPDHVLLNDNCSWAPIF